MQKNGHIFFISGPSGVGKGTIITMLKENFPDWHFPPSATTRKPRPGEKNGETYYFLSEKEFDTYIKEEKFLEWANVHGKTRYGTLKDKIVTPAQQGCIVIREFDVQGFEAARKVLPPHMFTGIFLSPADTVERIAQRIQDRAPISASELQNRLNSLQKELQKAYLYNHIVHSYNGQQKKLYNDVMQRINWEIEAKNTKKTENNAQ